MLGIFYLLMGILLGERISSQFLSPTPRRGVTMGWVRLGASFGSGTLLLTWGTYLAAWFFHVILGREDALRFANLLTLSLAALVTAAGMILRARHGKKVLPGFFSAKPARWEILYLAAVFAFFLFAFFHVFQVRGGTLYAGFTVFSDYGPHTAMIRSFSLSNNYPTQYPHFGGQDVRYHFLFQFLVGNLEYLGLRLDLAYNLASALSITSFFMVCLGICQSLGFGPLGCILPLPLFLFRSGTAFLRFAYEHLESGDLVEILRSNTTFLGYTQNENWGFWNLNVYLNQRHLCFGLCIIAVAVYYFLDYVRPVGETAPEEAAPEKKGPSGWLRRYFFSREAWRSRDLASALILGLLLGLTSFWNGAAVIGGLLILAGMALFSEGKLDYLALAVLCILFSLLQTKFFIFGEAISPSVQFGFLADEKSLPGIIWYLVQISGLGILGLLLVQQLLSPLGRRLYYAALLPCAFAFLFSLTPDIGVNHKYIMICYAFCALLWGGALEALWKKGRAAVPAFCILLALLVATGFYDFVVIVKDNDSHHRLSYPLYGDITRWFDENTTEKDLVLSPLYAMGEVTLSGAMLYNGWPYYAWSAGYDTYSRGAWQETIYTTGDPGEVLELCWQEGITLVVYEQGMDIDGVVAREDAIREALGEPVFELGYLRVYQVPEEAEEGGFTS